MIPITIDQLTKRFGDTLALDRITLRIEPGEIFFLLGPSGCGKTTLLRSVAGFIPPDSGRILFGDDDVTRLPPHRRQTGMMFQSYALWPHLTVGQNVAFGLEERRVPAPEITRRVEEALHAVHLPGLAARRIHQLSGGQQQRVALARALVIRPRCLLLDEPLSNLDARLRVEMRSEIRRICREAGLTALYVTHDQKEALSIADRMAVLEAGTIRQLGTPAEIYRRPRTRFIADFMGETNLLPARVLATRAGLIELETPLGPLHAAALPGEPWENGAPVLLSIRPESWRLTPAAEAPASAAAPNTLPGHLRDRTYLGEMAQYLFAPTAAPAHPQKIFELNPRHTEAPPDRPLLATVSPEDVVLMKEWRLPQL